MQPVAERCASCGQGWERDDVLTSRNDGPWEHTDCSDPKLDSLLLDENCTMCGSKVTDCGCVMGKSPAVHRALDRRAAAGLGKP